MTASEKALICFDYIQNTNFSSFTEFVRIAITDKKYHILKKDLGEKVMYILVCEKIGLKPDYDYLETLDE